MEFCHEAPVMAYFPIKIASTQHIFNDIFAALTPHELIFTDDICKYMIYLRICHVNKTLFWRKYSFDMTQIGVNFNHSYEETCICLRGVISKIAEL